MVDSCGTCSFWRGGRCKVLPPGAYLAATGPVQPEIASSGWCGLGANAATGVPFRIAPVATTSAGSFNFVAGNSVTVTDAACTPSSRVLIMVASYVGSPPSAIVAFPGNGAFIAQTQLGDAITAACNYTIYNG